MENVPANPKAGVYEYFYGSKFTWTLKSTPKKSIEWSGYLLTHIL